MILSNNDVCLVAQSVRERAVEDFEFFSNSVLSFGLSEHLCAYTQDVVRDLEDCVIPTSRPRALCTALASWLQCKNIEVVNTAALRKHEILSWLGLEDEPKDFSLSCILDVEPDGVRVEWIRITAIDAKNPTEKGDIH